MTFDAHANFAYSTIALAPNPPATGTTLIVASGQGALFPTPPFNATIWPEASSLNPLPITTNAEIVRVTAISGDTFTVVRAQEGTAEQSIGAGDQIAATITRKILTDIEDQAVTALSGNGPLQLAGTNLALTQIFTASGTYTVPSGATLLRVTEVGGGAGGSGGGSNLDTGGVTTQIGGAGGGAGQNFTQIISVTGGESVPVTIGSGGSGGSGAPAGGGSGSGPGNNGGVTSVVIGGVTYQANGGGGAGFANSNSGNDCWAGAYAAATFDDNVYPGHGGNCRTVGGSGTIAYPIGVTCGGGAGGCATTEGGIGGSVYDFSGSIQQAPTGTASTTSGTAGASATVPGCGGAGGGAGAPGGAGGAGGNGAHGIVIFEVIG